MDIRDYFGFDKDYYTEHQIYHFMKDTYVWQGLVLKVKLIKFLYALLPMLYSIFKYPDNLIQMVDTWENK